jgi:hypothetical protein
MGCLAAHTQAVPCADPLGRGRTVARVVVDTCGDVDYVRGAGPNPRRTTVASPKRPAPYRNYKFQVTFDGKIVAGVNKVSALTRTSEVVSWRDGGDPSSPHKSPCIGRGAFLVMGWWSRSVASGGVPAVT